MHSSSTNQRYQHTHCMDAEARAVINADFEEMHPPRSRNYFIESIKAGWIWIKQKLNRIP